MSHQRSRRLWFCALSLAALLGPAHRTDRAETRRPNIVFVLVDDMRWDEMRRGRPSVRRDAEHGSSGARGRALPERVRDDAALLAEPRQLPDRPVRAHERHHRQHRAPEPSSCRRFRASSSSAGYRTGFFGKWHMGNDDSPRPGFTRWVAMTGQGEAVDPQLNVDGKRIRASGLRRPTCSPITSSISSRQPGAAVPRLPRAQGLHPNVVQRDDGSVVPVPGQPGGFVAAERHRGRYAGRRCRDAPNAFKPPLGQARAASPDRQPAAARPRHGDDRR